MLQYMEQLNRLPEQILTLLSIVSLSIISTACVKQEVSQPQLLIRGSTSCPHCVNSIPVFEEQIYKVYKDKVTISLNTLSESEFTTILPQTTGNKLEFEKYTQKKCEYIPSWVLLDIDGDELISSC